MDKIVAILLTLCSNLHGTGMTDERGAKCVERLNACIDNQISQNEKEKRAFTKDQSFYCVEQYLNNEFKVKPVEKEVELPMIDTLGK